MAPDEGAPLDTLYSAETPEGMALELRPAGLVARDGLLIDVEPAQLPAQLVNRHRAVKAAGLL